MRAHGPLFDAPVDGWEYLRVSRDKSGKERSHAQQHDDHVRWADGLGVTIRQSLKDTGSASPYGKTVRDDFLRLLAALERPTFSPRVLFMWESSRGSRRVSEWARLIELGEKRRLLIAVYSDEYVYDCTNPRDVKALHDAASDAQYEASKTSMRVSRDRAAEAAAGKPHGVINYGYRRVYKDGGTSRRFEAQVIDESEAPVPRELYRRFLSGVPLNQIKRDFAGRGVTVTIAGRAYTAGGAVRNRRGLPFGRQQLLYMLRAPAYAGMRRYKGQLIKGDWPALVSVADWYRVQEILDGPERAKFRPGRAKFMSSTFVRCGVCGGPMVIKSLKRRVADRRQTRVYACDPGGHVGIQQPALDEYLDEVVIEYLSRPEVVEQITRPEDDDAIAAAWDRVAMIQAELDELADAVGRGPEHGGMSALVAARAEPAIQRRLKDAQDELAALQRPPVLPELLGGPVAEIGARWRAAPVAARREALRLVCTPEMLGEPYLMPEQRRPRRSSADYQRAAYWRRKRHVAGDHSICVFGRCPEVSGPAPIPVHDRIEWRRRD